MATIVTRAGKGSALTHNEVDANFNNLNNDKIEAAQTVTLTNKTLSTGTAITAGTINGATIGASTPSSGAFTTLSATGVTTVQAGTVSAPAITTSGDTNTGIFYPAADTVAIGTGGTERLRVDSSGNVGIATTSPDGGLDVEKQNSYFGDTTNGGRLYFRRGVDGSAVGRVGWISGSNVNFEIANDSGSGNILFQTNSAERMRLDASGNLGVGTTSPSSYGKFVAYSSGGYCAIDGNGFVNSYQLLDVTTAGGRINGGSNQGLLGSIGIEQAATGAKGGYIIFRTCPSGSNSDTERARITSGGYSKFSNDGTYAGSTGSYHEFRQTADVPNLLIGSTNASLGTRTLQVEATRSATSAYSLYAGYSGAGADLEFMLYGDGNGKCDGSWTGGGADYAEYFESATGAALTLGATVVLDGNKVREAIDQDPASAIMGVVRPKEPSKASAVIGNAAWNKWSKKYLTDDFDRYIMEDHDVVEWEETITDEDGKTSTKQHSYESHRIPAGVAVPDDAAVKTHDEKGNKFQHYKLNPAWNPDAEYVNRENRPEWIIVGLVGQVKVLKGQPVNDRWIKMRDVSATVEEWMIR